MAAVNKDGGNKIGLRSLAFLLENKCGSKPHTTQHHITPLETTRHSTTWHDISTMFLWLRSIQHVAGQSITMHCGTGT